MDSAIPVQELVTVKRVLNEGLDPLFQQSEVRIQQPDRPNVKIFCRGRGLLFVGLIAVVIVRYILGSRWRACFGVREFASTGPTSRINSKSRCEAHVAPNCAHSPCDCAPYCRLMNYSQLRRGLSPEDAAAYVGSRELLRQFERAKWLKPFVRGNRLTRFDIRDLDGCIDRLKAGELLPYAKAA